MARILLVDDDSDLQRLLGRQLTTAGYQVFCASNGAGALKIMKLEQVDLVITDIVMPDMDGCELIMELRGHINPPRIIAMSGGSYSLTGESLLKVVRLMGADRVMQKPVPFADLCAAISELLGTGPADQSGCGRNEL